MQQDILEIIVVTLETSADGTSSRERSKRESVLLPTKPDIHEHTNDETPQAQESESNEAETGIEALTEISEAKSEEATTEDASAQEETNGESTNNRDTTLSSTDSTSVVTVTTDFITVMPANLQ